MTLLFGVLVAVGSLVLGAFLGFVLGAVAGQSVSKEEMRDVKRHKLEDQKLYLGVLRRELANLLIQRDPDRFLAFYEETFYQLTDMGEKPKSLIDAEEKLIIEKYPMIADWDHINTHDYVLYDNGQFHTENELYAVYRDLVTYQTILSYRPATQADPLKWQPALTHQRLEHLRSYISEFKGTRLKHRLVEAMRQINVHKHELDRLCSMSQDFREAYHGANLEGAAHHVSTPQFTAKPVAVSAAESGYHIRFADGEEGMVGFFYEDRAYVSVYGVDPDTHDTTVIPSLMLDRLSVPYEFRADVALGYTRDR